MHSNLLQQQQQPAKVAKQKIQNIFSGNDLCAWKHHVAYRLYVRVASDTAQTKQQQKHKNENQINEGCTHSSTTYTRITYTVRPGDVYIFLSSTHWLSCRYNFYRFYFSQCVCVCRPPALHLNFVPLYCSLLFLVVTFSPRTKTTATTSK